MGCALLVVLVVALMISILMIKDGIVQDQDNKLIPPNPEENQPPSRSVQQRFTRAAVCTDAVVCSEVGRSV
jgi:hypothetical protein